MRRSAVVALVLAISAVAACEFAPATPEPLPTRSAAPPVASGPAISMDEEWTVQDDTWTFTGEVDPMGSPTSVVLLVGHDIVDRTSIAEEIPIADGLVQPGLVTAEIATPEERWLCVRFRAENEAGDGVTPPQCFPTDLPGAGGSPVAAAPTVALDDDWTLAEDRWTFTGRVDPMGARTIVALDVSLDAADLSWYEREAAELDEQASLSWTIDTPDAEAFCVRFRAQNAAGEAVTQPLCFSTDPPDALEVPATSPTP